MSLILFFQGAASITPVWPLDSYTAGLAFAFARKRLLSSYTGPLYRVRRSSDNTEQDIVASVNGDDVASLVSFVGANSAFVTKWYDQSGNLTPLVQATSTKQPLIVDNGFVMNNFQPDELDDYFETSVPLYASAFSFYYIGQPAPFQLPNNSIAFGMGGTKNAIIAYDRANQKNYGIVGTANGLYADSGVYDGARSWTIDLTLTTTFSTFNKFRLDGANTPINTSNNSGTVAPIDAGNLSLFAGSGGSGTYSPARLRGLVGYNALHSPTTADSISALLKSVYTTETGNFGGALTNTMWLCCSLVNEIGSYTGPLIRVRRSSDNTEQDIGFVSGGALDTTALAAFVGAGNGFVRTWYDQTGQGHHITQTTTAKQPQIVNAGTYMSEVTYDGVDDIGNYATPGCRALTFATRHRMRNTAAAAAYQPIFNSSVNGATGQLSYFVQFEKGGSGDMKQYIFNGTTQYAYVHEAVDTTERTCVYVLSADPEPINKKYEAALRVDNTGSGSGTITGATFFASTGQIAGSDLNNGYSPTSFKKFIMWASQMDGFVSLIDSKL